MPRSERVRDLIAILRSERARSQRDIVEALRAHGHEVTQATVSRDLKEVGAARFRIDGELTYRLPDDAVPGITETQQGGFRKAMDEFALSIRRSGTLLVVQTPPGHAPLLARSIDMSETPGLVGTIAGDDTIFVAFDTETRAATTRDTWLGSRPAHSFNGQEATT